MQQKASGWEMKNDFERQVKLALLFCASVWMHYLMVWQIMSSLPNASSQPDGATGPSSSNQNVRLVFYHNFTMFATSSYTIALIATYSAHSTTALNVLRSLFWGRSHHLAHVRNGVCKGRCHSICTFLCSLLQLSLYQYTHSSKAESSVRVTFTHTNSHFPLYPCSGERWEQCDNR